MTNPKRNQSGTDSVSGDQSFGVPLQYKGREHVWHKKVAKFAAGGGVYNTNPDMSDGGEIFQGAAYARGGEVRMGDGGAAFGKFPQMKPRRAKQDAEAAKNVPVDLARGFAAGALGAPGDIESLIRMPYDYLRAPTMSELVTGDKTSKTFFPTSEEVEKRLPFRSESPVSRAATGLGSLAGGFYTGPGAPIRLAGALPSAVKRAGQDFAMASAAAVPHVVMPTARIGLEAPGILIPSKMNNVREAVRNIKGNYGARRVERAADEILNLEKMYQEDALKEAFTGDNASAMLSMNPKDFERYAIELEKRLTVGPKAAELAKQGDIDKMTVPTDDYIKHLQRLRDGFNEVPYLNLTKDEVGIPSMPKVIGHEGRHRSRALADKGEQSSLVKINPRGDLREGLPRRTQEDYIEALREELERSGRLVLPEVDGSYRRPAVDLPDVYAEGGEVHMGGGGAIKAALAKLGKFATEADVAAVKEAGRIAHEQEAFIRAAKNADVEKRLQSMPPRSKSANIEMGLYHPVGGGAKLNKPFEAMHSTRVPNPTVQMPDVKILTPEDLYKERAAFYPLVGDKADTGTFLTHIGEKELEVPVGLGGGARYMDANYNPIDLNRSAAWESGTGRTTALGNQAKRAGETGNPVYGVYTSGSGTNTDFNVMGTNAVLQQLPQSKFTKKTEKAFDAEMRSIFPEWPGVRSEAAQDLLMDKGKGELRKSFLTIMGSEPYQKAGLPDIPATRKAIMDPQLHDTPTNESGFRIARMDPTGRIVEDPLHPSDYPTAMAGELAGQLDQGVDYKDMFSSHFNARRAYSQPESGDYYSFSRAHPIQHANQEWLDKIKKAQEAKDKLIKTGKYAKGGLATVKRKTETE